LDISPTAAGLPESGTDYVNTRMAANQRQVAGSRKTKIKDKLGAKAGAFPET